MLGTIVTYLSSLITSLFMGQHSYTFGREEIRTFGHFSYIHIRFPSIFLKQNSFLVYTSFQYKIWAIQVKIMSIFVRNIHPCPPSQSPQNNAGNVPTLGGDLGLQQQQLTPQSRA